MLGVDKDGSEWYQVTLGGEQSSGATGAHLGRVIGPSFSAEEMPDVVSQSQSQSATRSPLLISVGSLVPRKGGDTLIRAMFELRGRLGCSCPPLDVYGDGPMRDNLRELTSTLELGEVIRFHRFEPGIMERCSAASILVLASRRERSPLVVLEAMSRGIPVVATDVGEISNIIPDRRYGRVCRPDSPAELAEAIEFCLLDVADGRFDRDLAIERHRSLYSVEKFAERTEAVYRKMLTKSAAET